jgi:Protein of unknown function (DUF2914)
MSALRNNKLFVITAKDRGSKHAPFSSLLLRGSAVIAESDKREKVCKEKCLEHSSHHRHREFFRMSTVSQHSSHGKMPQRIFAFLLCFSSAAPAIAEDSAIGTNTLATKNSAEQQTLPQTAQLGRVARTAFTTAIVEREPVNNLQRVPGNISRLYFFSDLRGLAGEIVTHHWIYNDTLMAKVTFKVGAAQRWRVYSSKNLLAKWQGQWQVQVKDASGAILESKKFEYLPLEMPTTVSAGVSPND